MGKTKPAIIALVVCDNIYVEQGGKQALVGLFNGIVATGFPARHSRLSVFVSTTDIRPNAKARLEIVHGESEDKVVEAHGSFGPKVSPLDVVDMSFLLNNLVFNEPGTYFIRFWVNEYLLVQRPFNILEAPTKPKGKGKKS